MYPQILNVRSMPEERKLRILYVSPEINPFLQTTKVADFVRKLTSINARERNGD